MDRKEFLVKATQVGVACCGISLFGEAALGAASRAVQDAARPAPPLTPDARRIEWAKIWAKRFFDVLDQELDEPTRRRIMEHNGTVCHEGSLNGKTPPQATVDEMVKSIADYNGADSIRREGNVIYFNYVKNPRGLRVADGYCLCPLVEDGPPGLSGTFCYCSVGYVRHMFETVLRKKAKVDLLDSVKRGGKSCKFRVELLEA